MSMSDEQMDEEEIDELDDEIEATVFFSGNRHQGCHQSYGF